MADGHFQYGCTWQITKLSKEGCFKTFFLEASDFLVGKVYEHLK